MFSFVTTAKLSSKVGCTILHSHQQWKKVPVASHLVSIWFCLCSGLFCHFNKCVVITHCCFNLCFPDDILYRVSFHMLICHLCVFGEVSVEVYSPLLIQIFKKCWVWRVLCVCVLDNSPLSPVSLQIFFPSLWFVFALFWGIIFFHL